MVRDPSHVNNRRKLVDGSNNRCDMVRDPSSRRLMVRRKGQQKTRALGQEWRPPPQGALHLAPARRS